MRERCRLGGRIDTVEQAVTRTRSVTLDLGAAWVHGSVPSNPVTELVGELRCRGVANPWTEPSAELIGMWVSGKRLGERAVQQGIDAYHARMRSVSR